MSTPDSDQGEFAHTYPDLLPNGNVVCTIATQGGNCESARVALLAAEQKGYRPLTDPTCSGGDVVETLAGVVKSEPEWDTLPPEVCLILVTYLRRRLVRNRSNASKRSRTCVSRWVGRLRDWWVAEKLAGGAAWLTATRSTTHGCDLAGWGAHRLERERGGTRNVLSPECQWIGFLATDDL